MEILGDIFGYQEGGQDIASVGEGQVLVQAGLGRAFKSLGLMISTWTINNNKGDKHVTGRPTKESTHVLYSLQNLGNMIG